jgi:hypothetical protein
MESNGVLQNADENKLATRLQASFDQELLEMISNADNLYRKEVTELAREIGISRGLISNFPDEEFKLITAGGRENGPLDVVLIKEIYLKGAINNDTLVYVNSIHRWFPLKEVFPTENWNQANQNQESENPTNINSEISNKAIENTSEIKNT